MIIIISAQPRTGKTLYAVTNIEKMFPNRPIYHNGIPELKLPWILTDPKKWMDEVGTNGVLVVDEAQDDFGPTQAGKEPEYIKELSKHGHRGIDIVFITQHPSFLNTYLRKNCGKHIHLYRAFGWKRATVYEWGKYDDSFDSDTRRKLAISSTFSYPTESFGLYKSADAHTVKAAYPKIFFVLPVLALIVIGAMWKLFNHYSQMANRGKEAAVAAGSPGASADSLPKGMNDMFNGKRDPMRALGLTSATQPGTEPWQVEKYAKLVEPVRAPTPSGCVIKTVDTVVKCTCYTEDATVIATSHRFCVDYVNGLIFADWKASPYAKQTGSDEPKAGDSFIAKPKLADARNSSSQESEHRSLTIPLGAGYRGAKP